MYLHIFLQYNARVAGRGSAISEENDLKFTRPDRYQID
jgi:hypothetical protein